MDITLIPTTFLLPHPQNERMYGKTKVDPEFVETFRQRGVLQALIVTPEGPGLFRIIAGHRRFAAAVSAGLTELPCHIKSYASEVEQMVDLIVSNKQRAKTDAMINREIRTLKQNLSYLTEAVQDSGVTTGCDNDAVAGAKSRPSVRIAEKTGVSQRRVEEVLLVTDEDFRRKELVKLSKQGVAQSVIDGLIRKWDDARAAYGDGDGVKSLNAAVKAINAARESALKSKQKGKSAKATTPKATVAVPAKFYVGLGAGYHPVTSEPLGIEFGGVDVEVGIAQHPDGRPPVVFMRLGEAFISMLDKQIKALFADAAKRSAV